MIEALKNLSDFDIENMDKRELIELVLKQSKQISDLSVQIQNSSLTPEKIKDIVKATVKEQKGKEIKNLTFKKAYEEFLLYCKEKYEDSTIENMKKLNYKSGLFKFCKEELGMIYINEISLKTLNLYKNYLLRRYYDKEIGLLYINGHLVISQMIFDNLNELKILTENPFEGFVFPPKYDLEGEEPEPYELIDVISVIKAYFEEYLSQKSLIEAKIKHFELVKGCEIHSLRNFLGYLLTVSFVSRRFEPTTILFKNIMDREAFTRHKKFDPKKVNEVLRNPQEKVVYYKKKSLKGAKIKKKYSYIHPVLQSLIDEVLYYIEQLKLGNKVVYSREKRMRKVNPNSEIFVEGRLNPKIEVKHLLFSSYTYEKAIVPQSLSFYQRQIRKRFNLDDIGFHAIRYVISDNHSKYEINNELSKYLLGHATGTKEVYYERKRALKEVGASKVWQNYLWGRKELTKIRDYFLERRNFETIEKTYKRGEPKTNIIFDPNYSQKKDPKWDKIAEEIQSIEDNNRIYNAEKIAKKFKVGYSYVQKVRRAEFPDTKFKGYKGKYSKRLTKEQLENLDLEMDSIMNNLKIKGTRKEIEQWKKLAKKFNRSFERIKQIALDRKSYKIPTMKPYQRIRTNDLLKIYELCKEKMLGLNKITLKQIAKDFKTHRKTVENYNKQFQWVFVVETLFNVLRDLVKDSFKVIDEEKRYQRFDKETKLRLYKDIKKMLLGNNLQTQKGLGKLYNKSPKTIRHYYHQFKLVLLVETFFSIQSKF